MKGEEEGMQIQPGVMTLRQRESHLDMMTITQQHAYVCVGVCEMVRTHRNSI